MSHACMDYPDASSATCQSYVRTNWPTMATCLYDDWILESTACEYFGACNRTSSYWGCYEATQHLATVLGDQPSVILGFENHLNGSCYCKGDLNCEKEVSDYVPYILPTLANYVRENTAMLCTTDKATGRYVSIWLLIITMLVIISK